MSKARSKSDGMTRLFRIATLVIALGTMIGVFVAPKMQNLLETTSKLRLYLGVDSSRERVFILCRNVGRGYAENVCLAIRPLEQSLEPIVSPVFDLSPARQGEEETVAWDITGYRHLLGLGKQRLADKSNPKMRVSVSFFRSAQNGSKEEFRSYDLPRDVQVITPAKVRIINEPVSRSDTDGRLRILCVVPDFRYAISLVAVTR